MTQKHDNKSALILITLSLTLLAAGDATVRYIGGSVAVGQIIALRGAIVIALILLAMAVMKIEVKRAHIFDKWSIIRACAEMVSTYSFFVSIQLVPLATATTIVFIYPVMLTLVSIPIFGEKVGIYRWAAVIIGFVGVIVIAAPSQGDFNIGLILPFITAMGIVARDITTRYISPKIGAPEIILTTAIVTTFCGFLTLPFGWHSLSMTAAALMPLAAVLVALSFIVYVIAVRRGELSVIAPAQYIMIPWATFWGYLIWNEVPGQNAIVGGGLIVTAGLITLWREQIKKTTEP